MVNGQQYDPAGFPSFGMSFTGTLADNADQGDQRPMHVIFPTGLISAGYFQLDNNFAANNQIFGWLVACDVSKKR